AVCVCEPGFRSAFPSLQTHRIRQLEEKGRSPLVVAGSSPLQLPLLRMSCPPQ
ncbi:hypothetical protein NDU88_009660, partial [Pleurodeles waltl]